MSRRNRGITGAWLGVDLGSRRQKVASFCLIEARPGGEIQVSFERGQAAEPYPTHNTREGLLDAARAPTYLRPEIEAEVRRVAADAELTRRWMALDLPKTVSIDAPVALADGEGCRLTEKASTDTFTTPTRESFEQLLATKGDPYLRVNVFWKCVGFTLFRYFAETLGGPSQASQEEIASWTCAGWRGSSPGPLTGRLRETFPSDIYKRANGTVGTLSGPAREVLDTLVRSPWQAAGERRKGGGRPATATLARLEEIRSQLARQIRSGDSSLCMHKRPGTTGDLWDAFACAYAACCETHGGAELHGWERFANERNRLLREGAILTLATAEDAEGAG